MISVNRHQKLSLLCLVILGCLIYSNTLNVPFCFDDIGNIEKNAHIRLTELNLQDIIRAGFKSPSERRPIANISFALNYYVHHYDVTGYHVVNIMVHIVTGILLCIFLKTTLDLPPLRLRYTSRFSIAFYTTLIWLVHPIQTQSVTYLVQRMNSMAAMFYILSFLLYTKGRQTESSMKAWLLFICCTLAGILALGCKEIAVTLPFFIFLYEWYFFQDLSKAWIKRHFIYAIGALVLVGLFAYVYMGPNPLRSVLSDYANRDFTLTERILTQCRVIIYYVGLLLFPHPSRLNLLHDFTISRSLLDPTTTLLSIIAIVGFIGLAFCLARKEPLISFCIFSFLGNLVIESSLIGLEIIFEHRTYLPSMFFFLIIVGLAYKYIKKNFLRTLLFSAVVLLLSLWTYERNSVWKDPVAFWNDTITKSPNNARAYNNLGRLYVDKRNYSLALTNLKQAIHLDPRMIQAYNNLGNVYVHQGLYDLAVKTYLKALDIEPGYHVTYKNLGVALREQGNISAALDAHAKAIEMKPTDDEAYNFLGLDYLAQDQIDLAIEMFRKALQINPYSYKAYRHLGVAYTKKGDVNKAIDMYTQAIAIKADFGLAYTNLGILYLNHYSADKAIPFLRKATELDPRLADAHSSLGLALCKKGLYVPGIVEFKKALQLQPNRKDTVYNLGRGYEAIGKYEAAIAQYDKCIDLDPKDIEAYHNAGALCLYSLGDTKRAIRYFKKALSVDPQHPKSQQVKKALKDLGISLESQ